MVEEKKKLKRQFSAGGAVYKTSKDASNIKWLLINPKGGNRWQLPKGHIDDNENSQQTTVREVFEETGIEALVKEKIDKIQYFFELEGERFFKTITFFLMEYAGGTLKPQADEIERAEWFAGEKVIEKLTFKNEQEILKKAQQMLKQGRQENLL